MPCLYLRCLPLLFTPERPPSYDVAPRCRRHMLSARARHFSPYYASAILHYDSVFYVIYVFSLFTPIMLPVTPLFAPIIRLSFILRADQENRMPPPLPPLRLCRQLPLVMISSYHSLSLTTIIDEIASRCHSCLRHYYAILLPPPSALLIPRMPLLLYAANIYLRLSLFSRHFETLRQRRH